MQFEENLKIGDRVEARFTNISGWKRFTAEIVKINRASFRVKSLEVVWEGEKPGRVFTIPRFGAKIWSDNNGVFP